MNNDIKFEVVKYLNEPVCYDRLDITEHSTEHLKRKIYFISIYLKKKFLTRPSLEDLKIKNIIPNEFVKKEAIEEIRILFLNRNNEIHDKMYVAPSISMLVKKMDFEYKKILIIHKLGIQRK